jgi:phospholipase C
MDDDKFSYQNGGKENALMMFNSTMLPIKAAVAENFAVFNDLHGSVPSFSTPNHLFTHTGTSCGLDDNLNYLQCGGNTATFPQTTIYDSLDLNGVSFGMYTNSTTGACPEMELDGVARHKDNCFSHDQFYKDAAAGTLPAFSYLSPVGEACDHPCHDMAKGERQLKDIYEALRAGPGWENTLFVVQYDDGGGFYDHVVPPHENVPNDESPCHVVPGCTKGFDFRRLGIRVTSYIISPWIPKNLAIKKPKKEGSEWDLTSAIASAKVLFNLTSYLTKRDAWCE